MKPWRLILPTLTSMLIGCAANGPDPAQILLRQVSESAEKVAVTHAAELTAIRGRLVRLETSLQGYNAVANAGARKISANLTGLQTDLALLQHQGRVDREELTALQKAFVAARLEFTRQANTLKEGTARSEGELLAIKRTLANLAKNTEDRTSQEQISKKTIKDLQAHNASLTADLAGVIKQRQTLNKKIDQIRLDLTNLAATQKTILAQPSPTPAVTAKQWEQLATMVKELTRNLAATGKRLGGLENKLVATLAKELEKQPKPTERARTIPLEVPPALTARLERIEKQLTRIGAAPTAKPAIIPTPAPTIPIKTKLKPEPSQWEQEVGLDQDSLPYLIGLAAMLFIFLCWAFRSGKPKAGPLPPSRYTGKRISMATADHPAKPTPTGTTRTTLNEGHVPPLTSPRDKPAPPLPAFPLTGGGEDAPPTRVMVELASRDKTDDQNLSQAAGHILQGANFVLVDPEPQFEPDRDNGKMRLFFWTPGFVSADDVEALVGRLQELARDHRAS